MAIHDDEIAMVKLSLPEYLTMSKAGVDMGGLGFPVSTLLFAIIDIIGSYHRGETTFTVLIDKQRVSINVPSDHLRILNSPYFGDAKGFGLSGNQINRLYSLARSRVTHNALLGEGCVLAEGEPRRPAIQEIDGLIWIYLPELWNKCNEAVARFLAVADKIIPGSSVVRELQEREANQGIDLETAIKLLRTMPSSGTVTSVTAMGRPGPKR